jgi:hypothetical protein
MVIHGIGRFTDGKEFWNTRTDDAPYEYTPGVDRVIRGFEDGMREVREGDRIVISMKPELRTAKRQPRHSLMQPRLRLRNSRCEAALHHAAAEGMAAARLTMRFSRPHLPNLKDHYASGGHPVASRNANRQQAGDSEGAVLRLTLCRMRTVASGVDALRASAAQ